MFENTHSPQPLHREKVRNEHPIRHHLPLGSSQPFGLNLGFKSYGTPNIPDGIIGDNVTLSEKASSSRLISKNSNVNLQLTWYHVKKYCFQKLFKRYHC